MRMRQKEKKIERFRKKEKIVMYYVIGQNAKKITKRIKMKEKKLGLVET